MTEQKLYKFCKDKDLDWRGDSFIFGFPFMN